MDTIENNGSMSSGYEPLPGFESFRQTQAYRDIFVESNADDMSVLAKAIAGRQKKGVTANFSQACVDLRNCLEDASQGWPVLGRVREMADEAFEATIYATIVRLMNFLDEGKDEDLEDTDIPLLRHFGGLSTLKSTHAQIVKYLAQLQPSVAPEIVDTLARVKKIHMARNLFTVSFEEADLFEDSAHIDGVTLRSISELSVPLSDEGIELIDKFFSYDAINKEGQRVNLLACVYLTFMMYGGINKVEKLRQGPKNIMHDKAKIEKFINVMQAYTYAHIEKAADHFDRTGHIESDSAFVNSYVPMLFAALRIVTLHQGDKSGILPLVEKMLLDKGAFAHIPEGMREFYETTLTIAINDMEGQFPNTVESYESGHAIDAMKQFALLYDPAQKDEYIEKRSSFFENFEAIHEAIAKKNKKELFIDVEGEGGIETITLKVVGKYLVAVIQDQNDSSFILQLTPHGTIWGIPENFSQREELKNVFFDKIASQLPRVRQAIRKQVLVQRNEQKVQQRNEDPFIIDLTNVTDAKIVDRITKFMQYGLRGRMLMPPYSVIFVPEGRVIVDWSDPSHGKIVYIEKTAAKKE